MGRQFWKMRKHLQLDMDHSLQLWDSVKTVAFFMTSKVDYYGAFFHESWLRPGDP